MDSNYLLTVFINRQLWGYIFISPWLIGFFTLTLWPILQSFYLSFTYYDLLSSPEWIGTANFRDIFTDDPDFLRLFASHLCTFSWELKLAFALAVAMMLSKTSKGTNQNTKAN